MKNFWKVALALFLAVLCAQPLTASAEATPTVDIDVDKETVDSALETPGVLRVGLEANYRPFNWSQPTDANGAVPLANAPGEYANGYDVQVSKMIADALGLELEVYKIEWGGLQPALASGKIDAIIAGLSPSPERAKQTTFSDPYYDFDLVLVTTEDNPYADAHSLDDLAGAKVTGQLNTNLYDIIDQIPGVDKQIAMEDFPAMIAAVTAGKIDAYVAERPGALANRAANPNLHIIDFDDGEGFDYSEENLYSVVGLRKDSPLQGPINQILAEFTPEGHERLMQAMIDLESGAQSEGFWHQVGRIAYQYRSQFLHGTANTILIAIVATPIGFLIGLLIAIFRLIPVSKQKHPLQYTVHRALSFLCNCYIEVFRGTPMMVQALLIFYGSKLFFDIDLQSLAAAFLIVSINSGAYLTDVIRGGIEGIDDGQYEGAKAIGMTHGQTMRHVVLPQAIKNVLPAIGNEFVINIKDSSVLNVIAVSELFFVAKSAAGSTYLTFQTYFIVCVIYFILTFITTRLLRRLEYRLDGTTDYAFTSSTYSDN